MDKELYQPFKTCFRIIKTIGMWHDGKQSWIYFICGYLAYFIYLQCYMIGMFTYAFQAVDLIDFTEAIGLAFTALALAFKTMNFLMKISRIVALVESLKVLLEFSSSGLNENNRELLRLPIRFCYKCFIVFWTTGISTCVAGIIPVIFSHRMPYKVWFPFDTTNSEFGFYAACVFELVVGPIVASLDCAFDIMPVIFISFATGLLHELSSRLDRIGTKIIRKPKDEKLDEEEIVKCIQIHLKIKEYVADIQEMFSTVIQIQGILSTIILCACALTMSTVSILLIGTP